MRLIHTAPLAAAILLAACGSDADTNEDGTVSSGEAVAEAANAIKPQPGQYRTTTELLEFNVPGAPDALKQQIQAQMGGAGEVTKPTLSCLTPEQAAANGAEEMAKKMAEGNCTVARFDVSGGSISAEMQCVDANGGTSHVQMDGQMTSTSSTMTMTNEMDLQGIGKMQMKARVSSQRVGDCPA
jgi:hypothetical protein